MGEVDLSSRYKTLFLSAQHFLMHQIIKPLNFLHFLVTLLTNIFGARLIYRSLWDTSYHLLPNTFDCVDDWSFKQNSGRKKDWETSTATQNVEMSQYFIVTAGKHIRDDRLGNLFVSNCVKCVSETILLCQNLIPAHTKTEPKLETQYEYLFTN